MPIKIIDSKITLDELTAIAREEFGDMTKAVVDVRQGIMAIGGELHADAESLLSRERDSKREDAWGINLYPAQRGDDFVEFDSMVNIKPQFNNRSRNVENPEIREKIKEVVRKLIS